MTTLDAGGVPLGLRLSPWAVVPFAVMLLCIAVLPLVAGHFWERNRNKALVSALLGAPVAAWIGWLEPATLGHTAHEYVAFIILLGSLFVIAGGIVVRGTLAGTPGLNAGLLAVGAVLASLIGTTGASMLLIRPLLRANSVRKRKAHVVVFFIFVVSNAGGLLTPLGDPAALPRLPAGRAVPLDAAALAGVALRERGPARRLLRRRLDALPAGGPGDAGRPRRGGGEAPHPRPPRRAGNFLFLAGVVAMLLLSGSVHLPPGVQEGGMALMAVLSWVTTPRALREENGFTWAPIVEVAVVFAGIFATMIPALAILNARGGELGLTAPWQFFWATGMLSSFLDNAPTYLTFASTASGLLGTDASDLRTLLATGQGAAAALGDLAAARC